MFDGSRPGNVVPIASGIPEQNCGGTQITAEIIASSKIGDGLSIASFIMGLIGIIFGNFAGFGYGATAFALFSGLPMAVAAMITGALGARMQRIVNKTFSLGVAGAVLGLVAIIIIILGVVIGGNMYNDYYHLLGV